MNTNILYQNAHAVFGINGFSGNKAIGLDRYHKQVVKDCIKELKKNGSTICFNEEQAKDIMENCGLKTAMTLLNDEIRIEAKNE